MQYPGIHQNGSQNSSVLAIAAIAAIAAIVKCAVEWSRDFLLISALRILQLVVLALPSSFPFRAYFESAYLEELFLFSIIHLVIKLVLDEIQQIHIVHPVMPYSVPPIVFCRSLIH